ncbi:hypothetical protein Gotur_026431 [Gossypium turneri]
MHILFGGLPESMGNLVSLKFLDLSHSNQLIRTNSKIIGKPLATHSFRLGIKLIEWTNSIINSKPNAAGIVENSWKSIRRFHSR